MGESPDVDDMQRAARWVRDVDPDAATEREIERALAEAGYPESSLDAFSSRMPTVDDVLGEVDLDAPIVSRSEVERVADSSTLEGIDGEQPIDSDGARALADAAAREAGAPRESELTQARRQALQQLDGSVLKSNPDLDPMGEREIIDIQEAGVGGGRNLGASDDLREVVERTGEDTGTFFYETSEGRYPIAEVDL